jgi:hypothetical protein
MNMRLNHPIKSIFSIALCGLVACAPNRVKPQKAFDYSKLGRIEVQVSANDPTILPQGIVEDVSKNLAGWDYPVGGKNAESFSHILKATVGTIAHGATPPGFSFSAGNSDPRALEFQKTDVLPINCVLTSIAYPAQASELNMGFAAIPTSKLFLSPDKLADHISTVCFNLLTEVKWPLTAKKATDEKSTIKPPSWMPEIRIETKETPANPVNKAAPANRVDSNVVDVETKAPTDNEHRKQIIIYNQGSPLILELGHERR